MLFYMIFGFHPFQPTNKLKVAYREGKHLEKWFFAPECLDYFGSEGMIEIIFQFIQRCIGKEDRRPTPRWCVIIQKKISSIYYLPFRHGLIWFYIVINHEFGTVSFQFGLPLPIHILHNLLIRIVFHVLIQTKVFLVFHPNILYILQTHQVSLQLPQLVVLLPSVVRQNGDPIMYLHHIGIWSIINQNYIL